MLRTVKRRQSQPVIGPLLGGSERTAESMEDNTERLITINKWRKNQIGNWGISAHQRSPFLPFLHSHSSCAVPSPSLASRTPHPHPPPAFEDALFLELPLSFKRGDLIMSLSGHVGKNFDALNNVCLHRCLLHMSSCTHHCACLCVCAWTLQYVCLCMMEAWMLVLPSALPWVPFGCHAELSPCLSEMGEGRQPCVCVCVSQHDGWYSQHTQTAGYQQSLERKNGAKMNKK